MLATSTHDTKLGEDVRARINAISELPDEWGRDVSRWMGGQPLASVDRGRRAGTRSQ